jgi:hypothetical protein
LKGEDKLSCKVFLELTEEKSTKAELIMLSGYDPSKLK